MDLSVRVAPRSQFRQVGPGHNIASKGTSKRSTAMGGLFLLATGLGPRAPTIDTALWHPRRRPLSRAAVCNQVGPPNPATVGKRRWPDHRVGDFGLGACARRRRLWRGGVPQPASPGGNVARRSTPASKQPPIESRHDPVSSFLLLEEPGTAPKWSLRPFRRMSMRVAPYCVFVRIRVRPIEVRTGHGRPPLGSSYALPKTPDQLEYPRFRLGFGGRPCVH